MTDFVELDTSMVEEEGWIMIQDARRAFTPDALMYDEVLLRILLFSADYDRPHSPQSCIDRLTHRTCGNCLGFIRNSHVCRRWRELALNTPSLWIRDVLTFPNTNATQTILARSKTQQLELAAIITNEIDIDFVAERLLSRARKFSIYGDPCPPHYGSFLNLMVSICSQRPVTLQELSVRCPPLLFGRLSPVSSPHTLNAPALRILRFQKFCMPWISPCLTSLSLQGLPRSSLAPTATDFFHCLANSPQLQTIYISSFLSSLDLDSATELFWICLPKLKILQLFDVTECSLALLSRLELPPDVFIETSMESDNGTPVLAHFECGLQPHIQQLLSLCHFCSLSIVTWPRLIISLLPIGFSDQPRTSRELSIEEHFGPGIMAEAAISGPEAASFRDYMQFASYWLFPHTPFILRLDVVPNLDLLPAQWMELLDPFTAVDTLSFPVIGCAQSSFNLCYALTSRPTRVLPNLTSLVIKLGPPRGIDLITDAQEANGFERLVTELVLARLQTGHEAIIGRVRLEALPGTDSDYQSRLASSLSAYVQDVECVSIEESQHDWDV